MDEDLPSEAEITARIRQLSSEIATANGAGVDAALKMHVARNAPVVSSIETFCGTAIDALTHLIVRCVEVVDISIQNRPLDIVDQTLLALWTRACQSSFAIAVLLRNGFADDAYSRWRTVHELNVVAQFLAKHGVGVVARFNAHLAVKNYQVSLEYNRCAPGLKYEAIEESEMASLKLAHDSAVQAFKGLDEGDWAWAPKELFGLAQKQRVKFPHLEKAVGLEVWRAHVGMAHHNVHAGGVSIRHGKRTT